MRKHDIDKQESQTASTTRQVDTYQFLNLIGLKLNAPQPRNFALTFWDCGFRSDNTRAHVEKIILHDLHDEKKIVLEEEINKRLNAL